MDLGARVVPGALEQTSWSCKLQPGWLQQGAGAPGWQVQAELRLPGRRAAPPATSLVPSLEQAQRHPPSQGRALRSRSSHLQIRGSWPVLGFPCLVPRIVPAALTREGRLPSAGSAVRCAPAPATAALSPAARPAPLPLSHSAPGANRPAPPRSSGRSRGSRSPPASTGPCERTRQRGGGSSERD